MMRGAGKAVGVGVLGGAEGRLEGVMGPGAGEMGSFSPEREEECAAMA